jgi:nicotinate-nucleotide adenylyltransferase
MEGERIGILGGTFDPVHYAHLAIAEEVYCALQLRRVLFVPAGQPPHKEGEHITAADQRVAMLSLALGSNPHFALSLVDVQRAGPSYTVDTLRLLHHEWGSQAHFYFIIGGDSLQDLPTWHDPAGIVQQATIVALTRPGYPAVEAVRTALLARLPGSQGRLLTVEGPQIDLSATRLRQRVAAGRPIRYQTPDEVADYICRYRLYQQIGGTHAHATSAV